MQAVREKEWGQQAALQQEKVELEEKLGELQKYAMHLTQWHSNVLHLHLTNCKKFGLYSTYCVLSTSTT